VKKGGAGRKKKGFRGPPVGGSSKKKSNIEKRNVKGRHGGLQATGTGPCENWDGAETSAVQGGSKSGEKVRAGLKREGIP